MRRLLALAALLCGVVSLVWLAERTRTRGHLRGEPKARSPLLEDAATASAPSVRRRERLRDAEATAVSGATVAGTVYRESRARGAATVRAVELDHPERGELSTESSSDGLYSLSLTPGEWVLHAENPGFSTFRETVKLAPGEHKTGVDLWLGAATTVWGTVRGPDGRPIEGAVISAGWSPSSHELATVTDERGIYRVALPSNYFYLYASAHGFAEHSERVTLTGTGELRQDFELRRVLALHGIVTDEEHCPITGATICADAADFSEMQCREKFQAVTPADGRFSFDSLSARVYSVTVRAQGYVFLYRDLERVGGDSNVEYVLAHGGDIEGRIVRGADRSPVAFACIAARRRHGGTAFDDIGFARSAEDGAFRIPALPSGTCVLSATAKDLAPASEVEVVVTARQTSRDVVIRMGAGGTVRGLVRSARTLEPIAGASVLALYGTRNEVDNSARPVMASPSVHSDATGAFEVRYVTPGKRDFLVFDSAHPALRFSVEVAEGATVQKELLLTEGSRVRVASIPRDHLVQVDVLPLEGWPPQHLKATHSAVILEVPGIDPGPCLVTIQDFSAMGGVGRWDRVASVGEGETVGLFIQGAQGARLFGCVRRGGEPAPFHSVRFYAPRGAEWGSFVVSPDGAGQYEVKGLSSGVYTIGAESWQVETERDAATGEYRIRVPDGIGSVTIPEGSADVQADLDLPPKW